MEGVLLEGCEEACGCADGVLPESDRHDGRKGDKKENSIWSCDLHSLSPVTVSHPLSQGKSLILLLRFLLLVRSFSNSFFSKKGLSKASFSN